MFWVSLTVDIVLGAFLFSQAMIGVDHSANFIALISEKKLNGINLLQLYLIFINIITFLGFERSHWAFKRNIRNAYENGEMYRNEDYETPASRFMTWFLDILVFLGGGVGMLLSLVIHLQFPAAYNGNWWAFCYASIMFWFVVYCYICNPFGFETGNIVWLSLKHISLLVYLIGINAVSALVLYSWRKKNLEEADIKHTLILLLGAFGGTAGSIPMVFFINREGEYHYVITGFFIMLLSQITFIMYMMASGVL